MKLNAQELSELAKELLTHPRSSLQGGLEAIGLDDIRAEDLDGATHEDLRFLVIQCACGFWKQPNDVDQSQVCRAGCPRPGDPGTVVR